MRQALDAYLAGAMHRPFRYGEHDCFLFAMGAVAAMTGEDPAADVRGRYATVDEGLRRLKAVTGIMGYVEFCEARFQVLPMAQAQIGDVALIQTPEGPALGVVGGPHVYVVREHGLGLVPLSEARRVYRPRVVEIV